MALADEHDHTLTDHIGQVSGLITRHDLREVILVAHSYGGMVITGVAAGMPERIRRLVYVDAALPDPGQSLFDLFARLVSRARSSLSVRGKTAVRYPEDHAITQDLYPLHGERVCRCHARCEKENCCTKDELDLP